MTTMADLTAGTRIRHAVWDTTGTVRMSGSTREARWDGLLTADEISDEGPVFPADLVIIPDGAP